MCFQYLLLNLTANANPAISKSLRSIHLKFTTHTLQPSMYMSCQRHAPILFLYIYCMIQYIGRKLHPYSKQRQSGDFQKFTFDPSKTHNTHSTTIYVYVMSTPCSNFIPGYILYDTIHRKKITPLQQTTPIRRFPKVYVRSI